MTKITEITITFQETKSETDFGNCIESLQKSGAKIEFGEYAEVAKMGMFIITIEDVPKFLIKFRHSKEYYNSNLCRPIKKIKIE